VANLELEIFKRELPYLMKLFKKIGVFSGLYGKEDLRAFLNLLGIRPAKIKRSENWYGVVVVR